MASIVNVADSTTSRTVTTTGSCCEKLPDVSVAVAVKLYVLLVSLSVGFSKSGATLKVTTPVDELTLKCAESPPLIEYVIVFASVAFKSIAEV